MSRYVLLHEEMKKIILQPKERDDAVTMFKCLSLVFHGVSRCVSLNGKTSHNHLYLSNQGSPHTHTTHISFLCTSKDGMKVNCAHSQICRYA